MIKVQLSDKMVEVGGDFSKALACIKAINGRRFDGTTKTWNVPMSERDFLATAKSADLPVELPDGGRVTAWGNPYTAQERQYHRESAQARDAAEDAAMQASAGHYAELVAWLDAQVRAYLIAGGNDVTDALVNHVKKAIMKSDPLTDRSLPLPIASEARRQEIEAIWNAYWDRDAAISNAIHDTGDSAAQNALDED